MKVKQFIGPFSASSRVYDTGPVITDRLYTQIGITTIHQPPIQTYDKAIDPAIIINAGPNNSYAISENEILEFTETGFPRVEFTVVKDLPPETTIDIGYES